MAWQTVNTDDSAIPQKPDTNWKRAFRRGLLNWFGKNARDLPWRRSPEPYRVWVSEVMLQQTQVVTVIPYFQRFLRRFPDVTSLAHASEQDVLRQWEGLGYYRRARQLHKAAKQIVEQHDGDFPSELADVESLAGIGRYTARAILSIAFGQRQPILEANTIRVLTRLSVFQDDPANSAGQRFLWQLAEDLLPNKDPGTFNQALMELGSEICTPRNPKCDICPIRTICPTNLSGLQNEIPRPKIKTAYEKIREAAVIIKRRGKFLLRQCGDNERWAGMWDFPRFAVSSRHGATLRKQLTDETRRLTGLDVQTNSAWTTIKHGVTRFRITLECYKAETVSGSIRKNGSKLRWLEAKELSEYPLSVTGRKISNKLLDERNGHVN